jgi:peroxiredoxin family protein
VARQTRAVRRHAATLVDAISNRISLSDLHHTPPGEAAALGWDTQVFCTFYGLDLLNKKRRDKMKVSAVGNAAAPPPIQGVEVRVPTWIGALPGMNRVSTWMMKKWMRDSNIPELETLFQICIDSGVKFHACSTTMGVMNVSQDDIIDEASCLGATAFLDFAADADLALFV